VWETRYSSHESPSDFLGSICSEIFPISGLVVATVEENILFMSFNHVHYWVISVIAKVEPVELLLIERMHKVEVLFYFLTFS
jgi:hypothetical protein